MNWRRKSSSETFSGFLDGGTSLTGELTFEGTFRIDGEFHGSITTADILIVGPGAAVHADIKAGEVTIHGLVFGNIESTRRVAISATGRLKGDVRTTQLVVEDGALFEGRSVKFSDVETPSSETTVLTSPPPEKPSLPVEPAPAAREPQTAPTQFQEVQPEKPSQHEKTNQLFRSSQIEKKQRWDELLP